MAIARMSTLRKRRGDGKLIGGRNRSNQLETDRADKSRMKLRIFFLQSLYIDQSQELEGEKMSAFRVSTVRRRSGDNRLIGGRNGCPLCRFPRSHHLQEMERNCQRSLYPQVEEFFDSSERHMDERDDSGDFPVVGVLQGVGVVTRAANGSRVFRVL